MSRRLAAHVEVRGGGRVGSAVAGLLEAAGVGTVRLVDPGEVRPADLGPAGHRAERLGRPRGTAKSAPGEVDLVVLASDDGLPPSGDLPEGPHLVVGVCETGGAVGPLVVPGRSACLRCLDLSRTDRDPAWPVVQAQLRAGRSVLPIPAMPTSSWRPSWLGPRRCMRAELLGLRDGPEPRRHRARAAAGRVGPAPVLDEAPELRLRLGRRPRIRGRLIRAGWGTAEPPNGGEGTMEQ